MNTTGKYLVAMVIFLSCNHPNPKEAIVERQKEIKKEQAALNDSASKDPLTGFETEEDVKNSKEVYYNRKINQLQKEYDSLEVELKKY